MKYLLLLFLFLGCLNQTGTKTRVTGSKSSIDASNGISGYGRVFSTNPAVGAAQLNRSVSPTDNFIPYISGSVFITKNSTLSGSCLDITDCYMVYADNHSAPLTPANAIWIFDPNTTEFLQVNTYYHINKEIEYYLSALKAAHKNSSYEINQGSYTSAIPSTLFSDSAYWYKADSSYTLNIFANCPDKPDNAAFIPSQFQLCFGASPSFPGLFFSQDDSVIYHELGHVLVKTLTNTRNMVANSNVSLRTDLGHLMYDEGGAINEGLADYYSYALTGRTHFCDWACKFLEADRPIIETNFLHQGRVSRTDDSRLAYPDYLNYNPYAATVPSEDIHTAGMITSHFLVALTEELKATCSFTQDKATNSIFYLLTETLSELGDLTAYGSDSALVENVNLARTNNNGDSVSYLWNTIVNPVNYRTFYQTFSKYLIKIYSQTKYCGGASYTQDKAEKLLDKYGLLLFKTYNDNGSSTTLGHTGTLTKVSPANRLKSVLISKDMIKLSPTTNSKSYVLDSQKGILDLVSSLGSSGKISNLSSLIPSSLPYNNNNGKLSPGEIGGLLLNFYNDSNAQIGGVQVLANNWDHVKYDTTSKNYKACNTFEDKFPLTSEGAASKVTGTPVPGDCEYITRTNGGDGSGTAKEIVAPVCLMLLRDKSDTKWVTQDQFRKNLALDKNYCLDPANDLTCFLNFIPGADSVVYGTIDPKKTYLETLFPNGNIEGLNNLLLAEVSPWVPAGTTFDCRFRVRFTNCDDCYHDSNSSDDDYLNYEYAGGKPFKIIHYQFTVDD